MTYQPATISDDPSTLPQLPGWVTSGRAETLETVAFLSGAALTVLDQLVSDPRHGVPVKLVANRLALSAATATSKLEGRLAREVDIRDAYHLTPPGEARGPDGDLLAFWRDAVRVLLGGDRMGMESVLSSTVCAGQEAHALLAGGWVEGAVGKLSPVADGLRAVAGETLFPRELRGRAAS